MNTLCAVLALALGLSAVGCADAHAQPRRDAGAARRWIDPPRTPLLRNPFRGDGGVPVGLLFRPSPASDLACDLAAATTMPGTPPPPDAQAVGTLASPAREGRFAVPEHLVGVPANHARIWLTVAQGWVLRCLERVRLATPFDAPVRFTVARDGAVAGVSAEGAPEPALPCLVEGLGHARFRPVAQPAEIVVRFRYTVRGRPSSGSRAAPRAGGSPGVSPR
ncbi:MAG: hypothetical protein R3A48_06185 [Polyangiales bacterium]